MDNPFLTILQRIDDLEKQITALNTKIAPPTAPEPEPEQYLTTAEVCERLKVTRPTLWSWEKKGMLTFHRIGNGKRYRLSDILKMEG
jgi:excisionase family DNA binding protein